MEPGIPFTFTSRQILTQPSSIATWISCPECRLLLVWCSQSDHTVRTSEIILILFSLPLHSDMKLCLGLLALYHEQNLTCMFVWFSVISRKYEGFPQRLSMLWLSQISRCFSRGTRVPPCPGFPVSAFPYSFSCCDKPGSDTCLCCFYVVSPKWQVY